MSAVYGLQCNDENGATNLTELLQEICRSTMAMTGYKIEYASPVDCEQGFIINTDNAVAVALIMNELLFNAVKHSRQESDVAVSIQLHCDEDEAKVLIRNSGSSLPEGFDFAGKQGLGTGLGLVRSLLPRHGASLDLINEQDSVLASLILRSPVLKKGNEHDTSEFQRTQSTNSGSR
jgi:two-component sensor histidine kinase